MQNLKLIPRKLVARAYSTTTEKWDLCAAVCVERKPVVVPPMTELEEQFHKQLTTIEKEKSCKSPHEVRHELDLKQMELLKKGEVDLDNTLKQTVQDFIDASVEERKKFKMGSTITEDDKKKNVATTNRQLDKNLVLLTQQKFGDKQFFLLPQGVRQDGESLRQTAERIMKETTGDNIKAQIYSNAPAGFYKYKYPKATQEEKGVAGAKVFIYYARYKSGQLPKEVQCKWLNRKELQSELPEKYDQCVKMFLIDE